MKPKELAAIRARAISESDKGEWDSAHADRLALLEALSLARNPQRCSHPKLSAFVSVKEHRTCLICGVKV